MRHVCVVLGPWQTSLINHGTKRLSYLAKVIQLVSERHQLLNLDSLESESLVIGT